MDIAGVDILHTECALSGLRVPDEENVRIRI